jgi:hypothetical protein
MEGIPVMSKFEIFNRASNESAVDMIARFPVTCFDKNGKAEAL